MPCLEEEKKYIKGPQKKEKKTAKICIYLLVLGNFPPLFSVLALLFLHSNQVESYCERKYNPGNAPRNSAKTGRANTGQYTSSREGQNPQQTTLYCDGRVFVYDYQ